MRWMLALVALLAAAVLQGPGLLMQAAGGATVPSLSSSLSASGTVQAQAAQVARVARVAHGLLHQLTVPHHHHEDGSVHPDDSAESVQHLASDAAQAPVAMVAPAFEGPQVVDAEAPSTHPAAGLPAPPPRGLLRPPQAHA